MNSFRLPTFFLTPSALSNIALLIFIALTMVYLLVLFRRARQGEDRPVVLALLIGMFSGIGGFVLLLLLEGSLYPDNGQWALPLQSVFLTSGLVCLLQFIYRFPAFYPQERREAKIALWISLLFPVGESIFAVHRYVRLADGRIVYRTTGWLLALLFLGLAFVLLRKVALADGRTVPYWRKLLSPPDPVAQTARNTALLGLLPVGVMGLSLLRDISILSESTGAALISAGVLLTLLLFVMIYVNALPEQTSFLVKFLAVSMVFLLGITGSLGHMTTPAFVAAYHDHDAVLDGTALSFTPNDLGGYTVEQISLVIEPIGEESLPDDHNPAQIGFPFPFYGESWTNLFVMRDPLITFGRNVGRIDSLYQYGGFPGIFALGLDLIPPPDGEAGGLFLHRTADQFTATWLELPESAYQETRRTAQIVLYADGSFKINFIHVDPASPFDIVTPWRSFWLIGALSGEGNRQVENFHLETDLPFVGGADGAGVLFHLRFRQALHTFLLPILWVMLTSVGILILSIPLYFQAILVDPLTRLLEGIGQFEQGNYAVDVPVRFNDEFGALAGAFNTLSTELDGLIRDLEGRVAKRTAQLTETTAYLDNILRSATDYAIVTIDRTMRITYFNPAAEEMFGMQGTDALGQHITTIIGDRADMQRLRKGLRHVAETGAHEYVMVEDGPDGPRHFMARLSAIRDDQGQVIGYARFSRDITDRLATEAQLREQDRMLAAQEERVRLARDLHDSMTQSLHSLALSADTALYLHDRERGQEGGETGREEGGDRDRDRGNVLDRVLTTLSEAARQSLKEMRLLLYELQVTPDQEADLLAVLRTRLDRVEGRMDMETHLDLNGEQHIPKVWEVQIFYIAIEALNNALKHSGADRIAIRITGRPNQAELVIEDNGSGFDTAMLGQAEGGSGPGMGLNNIQERAAGIGGILTVTATPGQGTTVHLIVASPKTKRNV